MTREEAIEWFVNNPFYYKDHVPFNMAIKALKQTDVLDKIRTEIEHIEVYVRVDEHTLFRRMTEQVKDKALEIIDKYRVQDMIPVVHGEWIYEKGFTADTFECNQCHEVQANKSKFCPSCGAKMEKEDT